MITYFAHHLEPVLYGRNISGKMFIVKKIKAFFRTVELLGGKRLFTSKHLYTFYVIIKQEDEIRTITQDS